MPEKESIFPLKTSKPESSCSTDRSSTMKMLRRLSKPSVAVHKPTTIAICSHPAGKRHCYLRSGEGETRLNCITRICYDIYTNIYMLRMLQRIICIYYILITYIYYYILIVHIIYINIYKLIIIYITYRQVS